MSPLEVALTVILITFSIGILVGVVMGYSLANVRDKREVK